MWLDRLTQRLRQGLITLDSLALLELPQISNQLFSDILQYYLPFLGLFLLERRSGFLLLSLDGPYLRLVTSSYIPVNLLSLWNLNRGKRGHWSSKTPCKSNRQEEIAFLYTSEYTAEIQYKYAYWRKSIRTYWPQSSLCSKPISQVHRAGFVLSILYNDPSFGMHPWVSYNRVAGAHCLQESF